MKSRFRFFLLFSFALAGLARADGPHIAFHGTAGAFTVTLFSAPDPLVAGPVDLSLLVQNANDGTMVRVQAPRGELSLPGQPPIAFVFAPGAGGNPHLPGATVSVPHPGGYALKLELVNAPNQPVRFTGILPVAPDNGKRNTVLWAVFLPLLVVFLFLANQYGKQKLRAARLRSQIFRG